MKQATYFALALLVAFSCGGKQSVSSGSSSDDSVADDLDVPVDEIPGTGAAADTGAGPASATGEPAQVTFKLVNSAADELVFSLDHGWQPVIFAFSGTPPDARPIVMFPKFCTASCDAARDEICPYCPQPERVKDIRASEKRQVVAPGAVFEVPWDGQIYVYEKARGQKDGKRTTCECHRKEPVPPESYTVRACGLRITKSAKQSSKYQCVEGAMSFPADGPQVVELNFPAP